MAPRAAAGFPKAARLRRRGEFLALQRHGESRRLRSFVVIRGVSPVGRTRLGITVSRRVGKAVARNRVKRMVREIFRASLCGDAPAEDILVIARAGADKLQYREAAAQLGPVFRGTRVAS